MPFLGCIEERFYIMCAAEIVSQYVEFSSSNLSAANLELVAFDKPFIGCIYIFSSITGWKGLSLNIY